MNAPLRTSSWVLAWLIGCAAIPAEESQTEKKPTEPPAVEARYDGTPVPAPKGACVLFDGSGFDLWKQQPRRGGSGEEVRWRLGDEGWMEVVPKSGSLVTREPVITSGRLHIEWATPAEVKGKGQGRGNSGVFIQGFPEVQVLDSWENVTYFDGQAGALYKRSAPRVNASRPPGAWQSYDIYVERAQVENGKVLRPARITVYHNDVLIQDGFEVANAVQAGTLRFQDHNNPVRFRNIWFLEGATAPESGQP